MSNAYFSKSDVNRELLRWALALRVQLERWEPLVAAQIQAAIGGSPSSDAAIWQAAAEHHFALIAARNLLHAIELPGVDRIKVDPALRAELIEGRDLHEHWKDNLPVFNVSPRQEQPKYRSAKDFAARYADRSPYSWLSWRFTRGAMLLPNVDAPTLHQLIDTVEATVLARDPSLARFIPVRQPSPWVQGSGWWPKSAEHRSNPLSDQQGGPS